MEEHAACSSPGAHENALQFGSSQHRRAAIFARERGPAPFFVNAFSESPTLATVTSDVPSRAAESPANGLKFRSRPTVLAGERAVPC